MNGSTATVRSHARRHASALLVLYVVLVVGFLLTPIVVAVTLAFSDNARLDFPPVGFSLRWFESALANPHFVNSFWLSTGIGLVSALLAAIAGTTAAIAINHYRFRGRTLMQVAVLLPLSLPALVVGLGILFMLGALELPTGNLATVMAHAAHGVPYVTYLVLATLANYDMSLEQASLNLGASRWHTFWRITMPILRPGIVAGAVFAFLISFDNVSLSLFLARGETLPLRLMQHIQYQADPTVAAVSAVLIALSLGILVLFGRVLRQRQLSALNN